LLAQDNPAGALAVLANHQQQMTARDWHDERLRALVLQAVAYQQHGDVDVATATLGQALALAAPGGFIRVFIDEGAPMHTLLSEAGMRGILPDTTRKLLAAFQTEPGHAPPVSPQPLIEPLSERELEILALIAEGLSNREISERLFLALSTVKGHNRNIFDKLLVKRRTEAVARARELGLI